MENPFKNNSLASGLLGFILGLGVYAGGDNLFSNTNNKQTTSQPISTIVGNTETDAPKKSSKSFHGLQENSNGDVVITSSGKCYHSIYGCKSLKSNSKIRTVAREDAESVGYYACSKCNP